MNVTMSTDTAYAALVHPMVSLYPTMYSVSSDVVREGCHIASGKLHLSDHPVR